MTNPIPQTHTRADQIKGMLFLIASTQLFGVMDGVGKILSVDCSFVRDGAGRVTSSPFRSFSSPPRRLNGKTCSAASAVIASGARRTARVHQLRRDHRRVAHASRGCHGHRLRHVAPVGSGFLRLPAERESIPPQLDGRGVRVRGRAAGGAAGHGHHRAGCPVLPRRRGGVRYLPDPHADGGATRRATGDVGMDSGDRGTDHDARGGVLMAPARTGTWLLLVGSGIVFGFSQMLFIQAYRYATRPRWLLSPTRRSSRQLCYSASSCSATSPTSGRWPVQHSSSCRGSTCCASRVLDNPPRPDRKFKSGRILPSDHSK